MTNPDREELVKLADQLMAQDYGNVSDVDVMGEHFALLAKAATALRRLASSDSGVTGELEPVAWPANPNPRTLDLVQRFALALAKKLRLAEEKYDHTDGWLRDDWESECRDHLYQHLEKGDPRDVAAYCAFMWHHGWITYRPVITAPPADTGMREAFVRAIASLAAAISILERTPKAKKAVASDKIFDTMLEDYRKALEAGRIALTAPGATTKSDVEALAATTAERLGTVTSEPEPFTSDPLADKVPCHCHDAVSQRLCLDKDRCYTVEAQPVQAIKMPEYRYQEPDPRGGNVSFGNYSEYTPVTVRGSTSDPSSTRSEVTVDELAATLCKACGDYWWQSSIHGSENKRWIERATKLLDQFEIRRK